MFAILFSQNILRILKDSIIISQISAEVINFAKVYCVTPSAALFVVIYARMLNLYSFEKIFYYLISFFVGYFVLFAFILYPNIDFFHPNQQMILTMMEGYPYLKWYIALFGYWSYVIFYVLAELWPNIFYILLFWQLANEITETEEAKRFYTLFSLVGNSSLIVVGLIIMNLADAESAIQKYFPNTNEDVLLIQIATLILVVMSIISCYMVHFIHTRVMSDVRLYRPRPVEKISKPKMTLVGSFKYIMSSRYLWLILICSASFGLSMNLVENLWRAKIKELYPTLNEFASFNSLYILWTGVAIMVMTIIGNNMMRYYGWFITAVITPLMILITGSIFFTLIIFDTEVVSIFDSIIITSPLAMAVFMGAIQNIMSKGAKYSIWDTSREMLFIPLDNELKTKGKAAVDIISSKVGKSSSGLFQAMLFSIFPYATYNSISPYLMALFIVVCLVWIRATKQVNDEYQKLI
jgi:AAA family ATP:ADP antiporter